jgi:cellulase/cellobiase CelA1
MSRTKDIETPEQLWQFFMDYIAKLKANPFTVKDWVGKDAEMVKREKEKPVTMEGFRCYGYELGLTFKHYFDNIENRYSDFCTICLRIKEYIRNEQIQGGMAGIYNPSITQRLNGLVEKTDVTTGGEKIENNSISKLPNDVLEAILKAKKDV